MRLSLFLIATLGLSACATQQDATPPATATPKADMGIENVPAAPATYVPAQAASACNADAAKDAMGKQATDDVLEKAKQHYAPRPQLDGAENIGGPLNR